MNHNNREQHDYKISWKSWKGLAEILVYVAFMLCLIYTVYSFLHKNKPQGATSAVSSITVKARAASHLSQRSSIGSGSEILTERLLDINF